MLVLEGFSIAGWVYSVSHDVANSLRFSAEAVQVADNGT